jgi:hypothetical protein
VNYFFPTPTHKTKIGTANKKLETAKNKPHGPIIIVIDESEIGSRSQVMLYIHYSLAGVRLLLRLLPIA